MAVASALCLTLAVAANTPDPAVPAARGPSEGNPGVVFVIGGVGGIDALPVTARWALPRAEVGHEQCEFGWTHGVGHVFADLRDICHLLAKATELADAVRAVKAQDPDRPVYFLAHSGGCGVALAAAEFLPPRTLERIVLLSAAVSPTLDLRPALRATRCEIVSFHSVGDAFFLGLWTRELGTTDRVYTQSAGRKGFTIPADLDDEGRALYSRLVQIPWRVEDLRELNLGGHHSTVTPRFLRRHVAPWLRP